MKQLFASLLLALSLVASPLALSLPTVMAEEAEPAPEEAEPAPYVDIPKPDFLPGPAENIGDASKTQNYILNTSIPRVINVIIGIFGLLTFLAILIAAFNLLTHYGNEERINKAKDNLRWSIFGFAIMILAYAIVSIVVSVALPKSQLSSILHVPTVQAVDVDKDVQVLFPSQVDLIEQHDPSRRVSLPSGNLFSELIPAALVNFFYLFGFLVFVAFMVAGMMMVFARGNEEMQTKARNIILWGFVSLVCAGLGYAIVFGIATLNLNQDDRTEADDVFIESFPDETTQI